ncbi:uncharacterized protein LOC124369420 [Homalodisca vitripennis]|uniref:uncharacterized protein LOC124369420 n=1 Tax=Homalodisca vitripennis TaxID=197043 RepID=UPI001EEAD3DB|nr:uncharacterized protein LOC124369420 [Homalodisca vitripennis]
MRVLVVVGLLTIVCVAQDTKRDIQEPKELDRRLPEDRKRLEDELLDTKNKMVNTAEEYNSRTLEKNTTAKDSDLLKRERKLVLDDNVDSSNTEKGATKLPGTFRKKLIVFEEKGKQNDAIRLCNHNVCGSSKSKSYARNFEVKQNLTDVNEHNKNIERNKTNFDNYFKRLEEKMIDEMNINKKLLDSENESFASITEVTKGSDTPLEKYDPSKFERRTLTGSEILVEGLNKHTRNAADKRIEISNSKQNKSMTQLVQHNPKAFQRRTFDIWGLLGLGKENTHEDVIKITKEVPVPVPYTVEKKIPVPVKVEIERPIPFEVPKPYPVHVEKKVYYPVKEYIHAPYPVFKKVPYLIKIAVEKPIPVHISKPYPVYIEKKVPYPVEKEIPYAVKIPVDRPYPVHIPVVKNVYYPVEKKVHYPVPVAVEKPVPVPVSKPYPVYIETKVPVPVEKHVPYPVSTQEYKAENFENHNSYVSQDYAKENGGFVPIEDPNVGGLEGSSFDSQDFEKSEDSFLPSDIDTSVEGHDHSKLQKKKDGGELITRTVEKEVHLEKEKTTQPPPKEIRKEETVDNKQNRESSKDVQFGQKILKT